MAFQLRQTRAIVGAEQQLRCDPAAARETRAEPAGVIEIRFVSRQQQGEAAGQASFEVAASEMVFALLRLAPSAGDQLGEIAVAVAVGGEENEARDLREA